jgi:hypothetical protein
MGRALHCVLVHGPYAMYLHCTRGPRTRRTQRARGLGRVARAADAPDLGETRVCKARAAPRRSQSGDGSHGAAGGTNCAVAGVRGESATTRVQRVRLTSFTPESPSPKAARTQRQQQPCASLRSSRCWRSWAVRPAGAWGSLWACESPACGAGRPARLQREVTGSRRLKRVALLPSRSNSGPRSGVCRGERRWCWGRRCGSGARTFRRRVWRGRHPHRAQPPRARPHAFGLS